MAACPPDWRYASFRRVYASAEVSTKNTETAARTMAMATAIADSSNTHDKGLPYSTVSWTDQKLDKRSIATWLHPNELGPRNERFVVCGPCRLDLSYIRVANDLRARMQYVYVIGRFGPCPIASS